MIKLSIPARIVPKDEFLSILHLGPRQLKRRYVKERSTNERLRPFPRPHKRLATKISVWAEERRIVRLGCWKTLKEVFESDRSVLLWRKWRECERTKFEETYNCSRN